jgi:hypothetical protein
LPKLSNVATEYLNGQGSWSTPPLTTPGGSDTELQYNNSGSFGGISTLTWNGSILSMYNDLKTDRWLASDTNLFLGVGVLGAGNLSHVSGDDGYQNIVLGYNCGYNMTTAKECIIIGSSTGYNLTTGDQNFLFGFGCGYSLSTGTRNSFLGSATGYYMTTGSRNIFMGYRAGLYNQTGDDNVIIGDEAGYGVSGNSYSDNILIGYQVARANTTGYANVMIGYRSGYANTTSYFNVFIGYRSGYANTSGRRHLFLGAYAGYSNTTGNNTVALGYRAGYSQTTVSGGIYIGYNAGYYETAANRLYITNQQGSNESDGRSKAIIYGVMDATTANQTLNINAKLTLTNDLDISENDIISDTSTGTKIATAATQKLGFFGATPVTQRAKTDYNNWAAVSDIVDALVALGFFDAA